MDDYKKSTNQDPRTKQSKWEEQQLKGMKEKNDQGHVGGEDQLVLLGVL